MNLTHERRECTSSWERHGSNSVLFWDCLLCGTVGHERPEDAEQVSPKGQPLTALSDAMQTGNISVNVHMNDLVGLPNAGPGDVPGGGIHGQVE